MGDTRADVLEFDTLDEFADVARRRLEPRAWKYYCHGVRQGGASYPNCEAFSNYFLKPKVMTNVEHRDLSVNLFGDTLSMPMLVSPVTLQNRAHPDGECATARATEKLGTGVLISTWASKGINEVAEAAPNGIKWFQIHPFYNREKTVRNLIERAESAGYKAIVLTIDSRVLGREFAIHLKSGEFSFGALSDLPNLKEFGVTSYHDPSSTWEFMDWLKGVTSLPVIVKGILTAEAAEEAIQHGADGIVVSNQGERHLDSLVPAIDALPEVVKAVRGRCEVLMDGGVRKGTDILKALALGAKAVLIGRPTIWGLACGGEDGVIRVLQILADELSTAMGLCGCASLPDVDQSIITARTVLRQF